MNNSIPTLPIEMKKMRAILSQLKKDGVAVTPMKDGYYARYTKKNASKDQQKRFMEVFKSPLIGVIQGDKAFINPPVLTCHMGGGLAC